MKARYANAIRIARKGVRDAERRADRSRNFLERLRADGLESAKAEQTLRENEKFLDMAHKHLELIEAAAH